jgi:hypothetical protein
MKTYEGVCLKCKKHFESTSIKNFCEEYPACAPEVTNESNS